MIEPHEDLLKGIKRDDNGNLLVWSEHLTAWIRYEPPSILSYVYYTKPDGKPYRSANGKEE